MKFRFHALLNLLAMILLSSTCQAFLAGPRGIIASSTQLPTKRYASLSPCSRQSRSARRLRMAAEAAVEQKGRVTVYFKATCPYCKKALALLEDGYKVDVTRVNVLEGDDQDKKQKQMKTFSGRNTVPQIFFNSDHIGGNDDLQKLHEEGKLAAMVDKVRAEEPTMMKDSWYHPWY